MSAVPAKLRAEVYLRDGYRCIVPTVDPDAGPCGNLFGDLIPRHRSMTRSELTIEHVTPGYGRMGRRADHVVEQCVTLCWRHHLGHGEKGGFIWATANKDKTRQYLKELYP